MRLLGQFDVNLPDGRCMSRREISEDSDQIASRIAQKLRDAKFSCQIAKFVPATQLCFDATASSLSSRSPY